MILTFGHGTLTADEITGRLTTAGVDLLVDVRSFPGSRRNPHVHRERIPEWLLPIDYLWMPELGGRRKMTPDAERDTVWRHASFRAYAGHMRTPEFLAGVDRLLALAETHRVAFMCSEAVWWRCHRRMLADFLVVARGVEVRHLMHDGRTPLHVPTDGHRLVDGVLVYDGGQRVLEVAR